MPQYQGVWTLEQQAQAQSNQQWVTDPNFKNTTLLLQADGTGSGSQNNTFLDGSTNNFFITRNGNTTQGSFSPFSQAPGYWSNYFNSGNSYISTTGGSAFNLSGDYTVECWAYPNSWPSVWRVWFMEGCAIDGSTGGTILVTMPGASSVSTGATLPLNQWSHILVERSGSSAKVYLNGAQIYSVTNSASTTNTAVSIGGISGFSQAFDGYISNFRAVVGTAVYNISGSTISVPTTPLTAVTNTQLLICQSNRFVDNSSSARTLSVAGAPLPSVQAFGPFAPALQWTPDVVGGSGYFDGSDYLTLAPGSAFAFGTNDFTVECWIYPANVTLNGYMIDARNSSQLTTWSFNFGYGGTAGELDWGYNGSIVLGAPTTTSVTKQAWNHVAYTRAGTTSSLYVNGTRIATGTDSNNYSTAPTISYIGARFSANENYTGSISGMRVVNGTAVYTGSTYTVPTVPPTAVTNTSLLLNYTNAGIYDGKMANNLETVGNAQVSTNPVKYGSGSMYFDGTGDWLYNPVSTPNVAFGTGNFTVEMWVYPTSNPTNGPGTVMDARNGASSEGWVIRLFNDLSVGFYDGPANTYQQTAAGTISLNVWTHIACVRAGTILTIYINGVALKTATLSNSLGTSWPFYIGNNYSAGYTYYGYIDDLRITKGVARYQANFTPPQQALPRQ